MKGFGIKVTAALIAVMLIGCSAKLTDQDHIDRAQAFIDRGELSAAAIEVKNVLQSTPDNWQARALLGRVYFDSGDYLEAEKELSRALELGGDVNTAIPMLAQ